MALHAATLQTGSSCNRPRPARPQRLLCRPSAGPQAGVSTSTTAHATTAAAAAASRPAQQPQVRKLQRHERLRDPAKIGSKGSATVMVNDMGGAVSLATYMQLPVEQYYILDPSQIQLLSGNTFVLSVPKINLLGASLQPVITVEVSSEPDAVILQATDCQLNATGIMGGLDEKFAMQFTTRLTWKNPQHQQPHPQQFSPQAQEQQHKRELDILAAEQEQLKAQAEQRQPQQAQANRSGSSTGSSIRAGWDRLRQASWPSSSNGSSNAAQQQAGRSADLLRGSITGSAVVDVWCEVRPTDNTCIWDWNCCGLQQWLTWCYSMRVSVDVSLSGQTKGPLLHGAFGMGCNGLLSCVCCCL